MNQLSVKSNLPLGIAWLWVKASFVIFREKPINFMFFALTFVVFSMLPFMGAFFATLIIVRMLFSANSVLENNSFGLSLNLKEIFAKRNVVSFAIFSVGYDLLSMGIMKEVMSSWGFDSATPETMVADHRIIYLMIGMSLLRAIIFGISVVIVAFNPEVGVFSALKLNWQFIIRNVAVVILGFFLLMPFLLIPLYLMVMVALSVNNVVLFTIALIILAIIMLLFIVITTLFAFKMYQDGIIHE